MFEQPGAELAYRWIAKEAGALEQRLASIPEFASTIPMVHDAIPAARVLAIADDTVARSKRSLRRQLREFQRSVARGGFGDDHLQMTHRQFVGLRHRFYALLTTVDIFSDALTQRAEHNTGVLLRGLDALAEDGLQIRVAGFHPPPVVCYLDRGLGGAVRRAFTRLPGGERNAVALVRLPRERLSGVGLASLLHECGHQAIASLELIEPYRESILNAARAGHLTRVAANWWSTKISEVLPDAWACIKAGASASLGLFGVLSALAPFVFHDNRNDPHPMPYLRALFSVAFGAETFPHPIWNDLAQLWRALHPLRSPEAMRLERSLILSVRTAARVIAQTRPRQLGFQTLFEAAGDSNVAPGTLLRSIDTLSRRLRLAPASLRPCMGLAIAGIAQLKHHSRPSDEHDLLNRALRTWATKKPLYPEKRTWTNSTVTPACCAG